MQSQYFSVIKFPMAIYCICFRRTIKYMLTWQIRGILYNSISNTSGGSVCLKCARSSFGCPHTKRALVRCSTPILLSPETDWYILAKGKIVIVLIIMSVYVHLSAMPLEAEKGSLIMWNLSLGCMCVWG